MPELRDESRLRRLAWFVEVALPMSRKSSLALKTDVASSLAQIEKLAKVIGGIPVWEVFPESAAALAGVRFGDIIVSVNGTATPTFEEFLLAGEAHLAHLTFEVFREGQLILLSIDERANAS